MQLAGKTVLITGPAGSTRAFAHTDEGRAVKTDGDLGDMALSAPTDVTEPSTVGAGIARTGYHFGQIDIVVKNPALFTATPINKADRASYAQGCHINISAMLFKMRAVARHMIARVEGGKIINMASQDGRRGQHLVAVYLTSKAAVISPTLFDMPLGRMGPWMISSAWLCCSQVIQRMTSRHKPTTWMVDNG